MALWKETDKTVEQNLLSERDRQRQIARDRIEALKKQRADKNKGKTPATDDEPGVSSDITNETVFLQDSILAGMEKHQGDERDMLMTLVSKYEHNKDKGKQFAKMSDEDVKLQLLKLEQNYAEWEKKVSKSIADVNLSNLPPKKKLKIQMESQKRQKEQAAILEQALSHKFELELRQLKVQHPDISQSEAHNELSICALADLQEKQMRQVESTQDSIKNQAEDQLKEMRKMQRAVNSEGWYKTLASTLFSVSLMMGELHTEEDMEKKLMEEFEQQKKELLERGQREAIDVDAMLKELEDQYNSRKQALSSDLQRQREMFKQRLALKKQSNEDKEWNAAAMVGQIVAATQANDSAAKLAREGQRGKQDNLLQQKLQARREARRQAAEEAADTLDSPMSRESSLMGQASDRSRSPRQTPTFSLTREKTVVDVRVSDEQKQEMYDQVVQQGLKRQQQIFAEQSRQEELLKRKLELRSSKRENEAAALYSLGERQKTVLQQSQRDERERQLAQMKERVSKMRESRSKSPRGGSMKHM
ncbi:stress response protein NST1 isoform X2 [Aplysia californica]|uniref:Stress response protein NST1 isoform X2 n=1 Tax=Aplysia californica TaxID=6500 RepID=A0ABM0JSB1_APLCA|nr:stress response protein NST1 isoform X2 [Aplysia californica]